MTNMNETPVAIPIGEVARLVGVSIATVRNWDRAGKIRSFRTPSGQRRFWLSDVEAIINPAGPSVEPQIPGGSAGQ